MSARALTRRNALTLTLAAGAALPAGAQEPDLSRLAPEQAAAAREFLAFTTRIDKDFKTRMAKLNGTSALENLTFKAPTTGYVIDVGRGPVIEKGGAMMIDVFGDLPPRVKDPVFNRFYSIDIHPKTPWVGMVHLAFTLGVDKQGRHSVFGWMDYMPTVKVDEDLATMRDAVDAYFKSVGRDPKPHRDLICAGDPAETVARWRRKPSCMGVSLYPPPFREATLENTKFVAGAFETVYQAYLAIVERRANQPFGPVELTAQAAMRKNWLEDQLFSDPFASALVPYEAWSFASGPPAVNW